MGQVDRRLIEDGVRLILRGIGEDVGREGLLDTPGRVAKMYEDLLNVPAPTMTTFENEGGYDEMVVIQSIRFYSLCEHHMVPFFGTVDIAYIPDGRILGLSKFGRTVELYARRLQVQERMTQQIANDLNEKLRPKGVGVVVRGEHLCMSMRGVKKPGHLTTTSCLRGVLRDKPEARAEFLALIGGGK